MQARQVVRALKTPITMLLLLAFVAWVAQWALNATRAPIPPRPPDPCVMTQVGPEFRPELAVVAVYNGTETNGLAKRVAALLRADGFKVVKTTNAETTDHVQTEVIGVAEDSPEVILVMRVVRGAVFVADARPDHTVDIILGSEYAGINEDADLIVPLPDGMACLPTVDAAAEE